MPQPSSQTSITISNFQTRILLFVMFDLFMFYISRDWVLSKSDMLMPDGEWKLLLAL
uniref:Uncharacterized protein n=1 Tax=Nelumbo nucifera TaxID=4432 RepID=A0A822ZZV7_NELNU|nr:TPA_asm: hypothetical protein HUJ06_018283 [Nelumbo nucifera]